MNLGLAGFSLLGTLAGRSRAWTSENMPPNLQVVRSDRKR
jgi:hypothetical protein